MASLVLGLIKLSLEALNLFGILFRIPNEHFKDPCLSLIAKAAFAPFRCCALATTGLLTIQDQPLGRL